MEVWEGSYEEVGDVYSLLVTDQALLDSLDKELSVPLIMNYQMSAMEEQAVKELIAAQTGTDAKSPGGHERGGSRADARCGT